MLFTSQDSLSQIFILIKKEMQRAVHDGKHPFRYMVLATSAKKPRARYVVLRKFTEQNTMDIYTDFRSDKINAIKKNATASLLFYHPKKKLQVIVTGEISIHNQDEIADDVRSQPDSLHLGDYSSQLAPGSQISSPEEGWQKQTALAQNNFTVLRVEPTSFEVLQLDRSGHLRCIFESKNNWQGQWLVP